MAPIAFPDLDYDPSIHGDRHIQDVALTPLSKLSPFCMLILSIVLVVLFLIKQYVFEMFLMSSLYKKTYTRLNENERRGFINHHIAGLTKALILIVAVYPFIDVAFRTATLNTLYTRTSVVTLGDILVVCAQMLVGMYIFELIYRVKISAISTMHHIGTILVAQSAIAISLNLDREPDATVEFILCTVWGAFDIACELLPHIAIVLYRVYPTRHLFLIRLFLFACISTLVGTVCETIVIFYLFGSLWSRWQLAFKIVTPVLHCAFSATQLHGSRIFFRMWRKQLRLLAEQDREAIGVEGQEGEKLSAADDERTLGGLPEQKKETIAVREVQAGGVLLEEHGL